MGFRLVPKSVTLKDLKRRNGHDLRYFAEFGSFHGQLRKSGWLAADLLIVNTKSFHLVEVFEWNSA